MTDKKDEAPKPKGPTPADRRRMDEDDRVNLNRYRAARKAGMTAVEAQLFADSGILRDELERLVKLECPEALLAKILL